MLFFNKLYQFLKAVSQEHRRACQLCAVAWRNMGVGVRRVSFEGQCCCRLTPVAATLCFSSSSLLGTELKMVCHHLFFLLDLRRP